MKPIFWTLNWAPPKSSPTGSLLAVAGQIHQREQEIAELKQKIAEVMAVMPSLSYSSDGSNLSPVTPHYSSKFMDNSPSSLDPNASVYQPLKKWLWHPHRCQTQHCLFFCCRFCFCFWVSFCLAPVRFYSQKYHTVQPTVHFNETRLTLVYVWFRDYYFFLYFCRWGVGCVGFFFFGQALGFQLVSIVPDVYQKSHHFSFSPFWFVLVSVTTMSNSTVKLGFFCATLARANNFS